jgi:hypothetical protein
MSNSYHTIKVNTKKIANKNTVPVSVWLKRFFKIGIGVAVFVGIILFFTSDFF